MAPVTVAFAPKAQEWHPAGLYSPTMLRIQGSGKANMVSLGWRHNESHTTLAGSRPQCRHLASKSSRHNESSIVIMSSRYNEAAGRIMYGCLWQHQAPNSQVNRRRLVHLIRHEVASLWVASPTSVAPTFTQLCMTLDWAEAVTLLRWPAAAMPHLRPA